LIKINYGLSELATVSERQQHPKLKQRLVIEISNAVCSHLLLMCLLD